MEVLISRNEENCITSRLGICEQCGLIEAKYKCPRCDFRSCSLPCVNKHKEAFGCNGIRDKTQYKSVADFTDLDLLSDYRMLEETSRSVENYSKEQKKHAPPRFNHFNKELPKHLHNLRVEASKKGVRLLFLPRNFTRRRANTSYLNWKTKHIDWRIEWRYTWANIVTSDTRVSENEVLQMLLKRNIEANTKEINPSEDVKCENVHIYLAAEHTPGQSGKYHEMDLKKTISENLRGVTIVEFPIFHVVLEPQGRYPLVGTPGKPNMSKVKDISGNPTQDCSSGKKAKLTFYEVSDGEISDSD